MKRIRLGMIILLVTAMEVGCMDPNTVFRNNGDKAIEYVEKKYGKEFEPYTYEVGDYLSETDNVRCYTEGLDRENEYVRVTISKENGKIVYGDNYFGYLIRPELEAYLLEMISVEFQEVKLYVDFSVRNFPNTLTTENTLEDFFREVPDYTITFHAYVKALEGMSEDAYDSCMQRIENRLLESGRDYTAYIFVVNEEWFSSIERYKQDDFWLFYVKNRKPDYENYFYLYNEMIEDGKVN